MLRLARHMEQQTQATVLSARRAEESMGQEMAGLVQNLAQDYAELCMISRDAIETIPAPDQAEKLRWAVKNIGQTTRGLLQAAIGVAAGKPESAPIGGARHITGAASSLRSLDFSAGSMNDRVSNFSLIASLICLVELDILIECTNYQTNIVDNFLHSCNTMRSVLYNQTSMNCRLSHFANKITGWKEILLQD